MTNFPAAESYEIPKLPEGWYLVSLKVLSNDTLALVSADVDVLSRLKNSAEMIGSSQQKNYLDGARAKIWIFDGAHIIEGLEFNLLDPFPIVDQFSDGRWLVSYSRSDGKANTRIFDTDGLEVNRIELGDGIEHIKIDDSHRICVGWFDEGVYGNSNWHYEGRKWPPSSSGMATFDVEGNLVQIWEGHIIDDCYAMNVFGNEIWACTYSDFPILRMDNSRKVAWKSNLSGVKAISIGYPYVIAAGGYRDDFNQIRLLRLQNEESEILNSWRVPQLKTKFSHLDFMDGRADRLHVVKDDIWHRWHVKQFVNCLSDP